MMATIHYTKDHEYVRVDNGIGEVGISNYAQEQLGDVVFVEVPDVGRTVAKRDEVAVVESVKAASEIYSPIGGEVTEANAALADSPALVNEDAEGAAWFFKLKVSDLTELDDLMDEAAYAEYVKGLE